MATKIRDLAVKVGEHTDREGNTKGRYLNVGAMMKSDDGEFLVLHRAFNPAGVPNPDGRDTVLVSCFKTKERDAPTQHDTAKADGYQKQDSARAYAEASGGATTNTRPQPANGADFDDDIPW